MKKIIFILFFIQCSFANQNDIHTAVEAMLAQHVKNVERYEIEFRALPRDLQAIDAHSSVVIVDEPRASYKGLLTIPVDVTSSNGVRKRYFVNACVRTYETVAVSTKLINRRESVNDSNIAFQAIETTSLPDDVMKKSNYTSALRSKLILSAGRVVTMAHVETFPLVTAGSIVLVNLRTDNVKLSFSGKAKEDGWNGSIIDVELSEAKRNIKAKVIADDVVEMVK